MTVVISRAQVKQNIRTELRESTSPLVVTFEKNDGEIRVMKCTTNLDLVPPSQWPDKKLTEHLEDTAVTTYRVYDIEKEAWRSFKLDSIMSITNKTTTYNIRD